MQRIACRVTGLFLVTALICSCSTPHVLKGYDGDALERKALALVAVKDVCSDIANKPCVPSSCTSDIDFYFSKIFNEKSEKETVLWRPNGGLSNNTYHYMIITPGPYAVGVQFFDHSDVTGKDKFGKIIKTELRNNYGFAYVNLYAETNGVYRLECRPNNGVSFKKMPMGYSAVEWLDTGYDRQYVRE